MARAADVAMLRRIVEIRDAQRQSAQLRATEAAAELSACEHARAEQKVDLDHEIARWAEQVHRGGALALTMAPLLSASVGRSDASLRRLDERVRSAEAVLSARREAWRVSLQSAEVATGLFKTASKNAQRRRDEAQLNALGERKGGGIGREN